MSNITISLKLHKPSKQKCKLLEFAMENYSKALQFLVELAFCDIVSCEKFYREGGSFALAKWVDKDISKQLNRFGVKPFKDSLKADFSMLMMSYFDKSKEQFGTNSRQRRKLYDQPIVYVDKQDFEQIYNQYLDDTAFDGQSNYSHYKINKLINKSERVRPMYFCRTDTIRDFCILYNDETHRFYIKIYLLDGQSTMKRKPCPKDSQLRYVHKKGGKLQRSRLSERFIIVPLEFGKWQEVFLKKALQHPEMIKAGRLKVRNNQYFMDINIELKDIDNEDPKTYIAVTRGINEPLNYAIIDKEQLIVESGVLIQNIDFNPLNCLSVLKMAANKICMLSIKHQSKVLVESFEKRSDNLNFINGDGVMSHPMFTVLQYQEFVNILTYKLAMKEQGRPLKISPVDIYYRCPLCHNMSKKNRCKIDLFICTYCATTMDIDRLGSVNLAGKLMQYKKSLIRINARRQGNSIIFENKELGLMCECSLEVADYLQLIVLEIKKIVENFKYQGSSRKQQSLIKKIEQTEDITKIIDII